MLYEAKWTDAAKAAYFKSHPENCAGPDGSFPIKDASDVGDAWDLAGHAADADAVRAKIKSIAKRLGFTSSLPATSTESVSPSTTFTPKPRVASLKTKFLSYGAKSRNGRIYPQEAVSKLVCSAQLALSTPGADPLTCYISHGEADNDNSLKLAGKITKVWEEGGDAWANIDMPDTTTGREAATLAKHGYLKTSLRASGAILKLSQESGLPFVTGDDLRLQGIDFTTTPGIETVTVEDVVLESAEPQTLSEIFETPTALLLLEEEEQPLQEAPKHAVVETGKLQEIHDHIANAQGRPCAPGGMAKEAGRKFSAATQEQMDAAHDKLAEALGIECASGDMAGDDGMNDGDDPQENLQPIPQEENSMTLEEAKKLLEEAGHTVQPPKTPEEKLQEALDAKLAEQQKAFDAKLEEMKKAFMASQPAPQRQSLVEGANVGNEKPNNPKIYRNNYLQEQLKGMDWGHLADRTQPLPDNIDATRLLNEFGRLYLYKTGYYDGAAI